MVYFSHLIAKLLNKLKLIKKLWEIIIEAVDLAVAVLAGEKVLKNEMAIPVALVAIGNSAVVIGIGADLRCLR